MRAHVVLASACLLIGCATHSGRPTHGQPPAVLGQRVVPTVNGPIPDHWARLFVGQLPRPRLAGYMRSERSEGEERALFVHWVYDPDMKLVGVVGDSGHTTRFDRFGKPHFLGALPIDKSVLAIFDYENPEENPVRFIAMPEPKD
jgi:hypothetical protein